MSSSSNRDVLAPLAIFLAASLWGVYWLPLRALNEAGITGLWAIVLLNFPPFAALAVYSLVRRRGLSGPLRMILLVGVFSGTGLALYAAGLVHGSVIRATVLFYLAPVWSTLLERLLLKEKTSSVRWFAIVLGLLGLLLLLAGREVFSARPGAADAAALLSGIAWSFAAVQLRGQPNVSSIDTGCAQFLFACLSGAALAWIWGEGAAMPGATDLIASLPLTVGVGVFLLIPTILLIFWGAGRVSPGTVGLLMMSEVVVAIVSAIILNGERPEPVHWAGILLILTAGLLDVLSQFRRSV